MFCPNCGSPIDEGLDACVICGGELAGSIKGDSSSEAASVSYFASDLAQEESFVRASVGYQTFACPNCGMSTLVPDANGVIAHCESCGSDVDIRTREITVERHEHTHNYITYQNLSDQFELSHDSSIVRGLGASARLNAAHIVIPENQGILAIGDGLLFGSEITESVELPAGLQRIGASAFCNCQNLQSIEIPASVTMIDSSAFENCSSLTRVVVPDNARLGENVFRGCTSLREVVIGSKVVGGAGAFIACTSLSHVVIGDGTNVADSMFANCPALTLVDFAGPVASIDEYAFCDCVSLVELRIPFGLATIGGAAFRGCTALHRIDLPSSLDFVGTNAFEGCVSLGDVDCSSVRRFGDGVFKGCAGLVHVTLGDQLMTIPPSTFEDCARLMEIDIPVQCTKIGIRSFAGCSSLGSCVLPPAIDSIPKEAFRDCTCLTSVGDHALNVGAFSFAGCANLKNIMLKGDVSQGAFLDCSSLETIAFAGSTRRIGDAAFMHVTALEKLIVPMGVSVVDSSAFQGCANLHCIVLAASVEEIGHRAFYNCAELEEIVFSGSSPRLTLNAEAFGENPYLRRLKASMALFTGDCLKPLLEAVPSIDEVVMNNFDSTMIKDLRVDLFGDRMVEVNGAEVRWRSWIESHYPAPEGQPVDLHGSSKDKNDKRGLFGLFGK